MPGESHLINKKYISYLVNVNVVIELSSFQIIDVVVNFVLLVKSTFVSVLSQQDFGPLSEYLVASVVYELYRTKALGYCIK